MKNLVRFAKKVSIASALVSFLCAYSGLVAAQDLLKKEYPDRYVVKKGDTLWGIASQYLNEPWRWKSIWQANPDIKNPDLIYPGDVLMLTYVDGKPVLRALRRETVKLKPQIRSEDYVASVPPVSPRAIKPFMISPLVTSADEVQSSAYIVDGVNNHLIGGKNVQMYARGLKETTSSKYHIFRKGRVFIHPETGEQLGVEAIDLGRAQLLKPGDPAKVEILSSKGLGILAGDFLRPISEDASVPFFFPSAHDSTGIRGVILPMSNRNREMGKLDIVAVTIGSREQVQPGQVFKVVSKKVTKKDPINPKKVVVIPEERIGLIMIIRVFDRISYGIVTDASRAINAGDNIIHPDS